MEHNLKILRWKYVTLRSALSHSMRSSSWGSIRDVFWDLQSLLKNSYDARTWLVFSPVALMIGSGNTVPFSPPRAGGELIKMSYAPAYLWAPLRVFYRVSTWYPTPGAADQLNCAPRISHISEFSWLRITQLNRRNSQGTNLVSRQVIFTTEAESHTTAKETVCERLLR